MLWQHHVRAVKGEPQSGGVPAVRAAQRPHPGGQMHVPSGFDGLALYEAARGPVVRSPGGSAQDRTCTGI